MSWDLPWGERATAAKDYTVGKQPEDGQWYVFRDGARAAGPFALRDEALGDARDRAVHTDGPASVEGEDVRVQVGGRGLVRPEALETVDGRREGDPSRRPPPSRP